MMQKTRLLVHLMITLALVGCATQAPPVDAEIERPNLKDVFADAFLVGVALNEAQFRGEDTRGAEIARRHFNSATAENVMKWEIIHPQPGRFDFDAADAFVEFAERNSMFIVGHTLIWHSQTPGWVFEDETGAPVSREALIERMRNHIHTVVGRYQGRVHGWDVVNEALDEDGALRESPWRRIIGDDYIRLAFEFAREADPEAELYYNDYSLENAPKREGAVRLVEDLLEAGLRVDAIGTQGHYKMDWPTPAQIDSTVKAFAGLGVGAMITEIDIDLLPPATDDQGADVALRAERQAALDPFADGLPPEMQQALADRYAEIFEVFVDNRDLISRVTFWGVADGDSWLNNWPVPGRTSYPLLFDRDHEPKLAFDAVVKTISD